MRTVSEVAVTVRARIAEGRIEPMRPLGLPDGQEVTVTIEPFDLETQRRREILEEANRCYARLRADEAAWQEELDERRLWEGALADDVIEE